MKRKIIIILIAGLILLSTCKRQSAQEKLNNYLLHKPNSKNIDKKFKQLVIKANKEYQKSDEYLLNKCYYEKDQASVDEKNYKISQECVNFYKQGRDKKVIEKIKQKVLEQKNEYNRKSSLINKK